MKKGLRLLLIYIFLSGAGSAARAQSEKEMAEEYFKKDDCPKALTYYTALLKSAFEKAYLRNYTSCII